jgi:hypothetical protein
MIAKDAITPQATIMIQLLENASKDDTIFSLMQTKYVWNIICKALISSYGQTILTTTALSAENQKIFEV